MVELLLEGLLILELETAVEVELDCIDEVEVGDVIEEIVGEEKGNGEEVLPNAVEELAN